jgi:uncharacterized SAM-binding protein YcdF (DUF218 family)
MAYSLLDFAGAWLLPPLLMLVLLFIGLALWRRHPRLALTCIAAGTALLWLAATPIVAESLLRLVEGAPPRQPVQYGDARAIVVLGGGTYVGAPEYGADTANMWTLERLRYVARLYRLTSLRVLVSGGNAAGARSSEAEQMREILQQDFSTPVSWMEDASLDTLDSAIRTEQVLRSQGIRKVVLVTHAWHMPRARLAFKHAGLETIPAPVGFSTHSSNPRLLLRWLPSAQALVSSRLAWRETLALGWYRVRILFT